MFSRVTVIAINGVSASYTPDANVTKCLIYSFFLIKTLGFYLASLIFITLLSFLLGEKRILILFFFPILLMTVVFVSFEIGFNIFLAEGNILPQLSSIF